MPLPTTTVAIINDNEETLAMLKDALQHEHFHVVATRTREANGGETDLGAFVTEHDPRVIIWDVPVPYEKNWMRLTLVRSTGVLDGRGLVVTTTHKGHLDGAMGSDSGAIEILGKPYDVESIVRAVKDRAGC